MPASTLLLSAALAVQPAPPAPAEEPDSPPIVVTGERDPRNPLGGIEQPYSETERVPLGSRIARRVERRPFQSVASESGLAGMVGNSGDGNWDGTGGSGHGVRMRRVTECVAERREVSEAVACMLHRVKTGIEMGDHAAAAAALAPLLERSTLSAWERYYVGYYAFELGEAMQDDVRRGAALSLMLASSEMPETERPQALRALASIALRGGDDQTAIVRLEALAESVPGDARTRANLAALYARNGRDDRARMRMAEAVAIVRRSGGTPPAEWTAFLARAN